MTVATTTNTAIGTGNGVATVFPFTFGTLPTGDLVVTLIDLDGNEEVQTEITDYTVSGEGAEDGGSVNFLVAPPVDYTVLIQRILPYTQPTDYKNQGSFYPRTHERSFDRVTMQIQQLAEADGRTIKIPAHVQGVSTTLPTPVANGLWGWDEDADSPRYYTPAEIGTTLAFSNFIADTFTAAVGQTEFVLSEDPGVIANLDVSVDGVTQVPVIDYTLDATTVTFATPMVGGEKVLIRYGTALPTGITAASAINYTPPSTGIAGSIKSFLDSLWTAGASSGAALIRFLQSGTGAVARTVQDKLREIEVTPADFGYTGSGDIGPYVQAAINSLPARGGRVRLPPGQHNVATQIIIGDGNGAGTPSTKNGIKLIGHGAGFAISGSLVPTVFNWTGASTTSPMIVMNGQISDCEISGMFLACNGNVGGITLQSFSGCRFRHVKIVNPKASSVALFINGGGAPVGNYNIYNDFSDISIGLLSASSIGLLMDGNYAVQNDTWISSFDRVRIETVSGATNAVCAWFKFVDSCTFRRCHFDSTPEATSIGAVFDALSNDQFPAGLAFYDCSIKNHSVSEDGSHTIRKNYFYGFGTYDLEVIPTHSKLVGITDDGQVFGEFLYNSAWTTYAPTVTLVGGAGNTVPVYATNWGAYKKIGKTVHYTILLDGDGGAEGAGTGTVNIALPIAAASGNRYWESHGRIVNDVNSYVGIARIDAGASTIRVRHFNTATTTGDVPGSGQGSAVRTITFSGTYECA